MNQSQRRTFLRVLSLCPMLSWDKALAATAASASPAPTVHTVRIAAAQFSPKQLHIKKGDSVNFINEDIVPHTATGTRDDNDWDTGTLNRSDGKQIKFESAGQFPYFCRFHPSMIAHITVA